MKIEHLHRLFLESEGVTTDSRKIKSAKIYFALKGDNFNGNTFADEAIKKGASYAVIDEQAYARGPRYILVKDVLQKLQELASFHRRFLNTPMIAITGSNGKTTSKELIHAVLRKKFETVATQGNLNNHIGVPLTLLRLKSTTELCIVEMGANHPGEIRKLCEIANPDYGYITNFGKAHLEGFGNIEGVISAKSELYTHLEERQKYIFINADDPIQQKKLSYANVFSFGQHPQADLNMNFTADQSYAAVSFKDITYSSSLYGNYNAVNIAAAVCMGIYFNVPADSIQKAISNYAPSNNRSQIIHIGTATLLLDAYNANPTSMRAALESFKENPAPYKTVILGDMFELGKEAEREHQEIATYLETLNLDSIFLVGNNFYRVNTTATNIIQLESYASLEQHLKTSRFNHHHILIKGSRGMALERVVEVLKAQENSG